MSQKPRNFSSTKLSWYTVCPYVPTRTKYFVTEHKLTHLILCLIAQLTLLLTLPALYTLCSHITSRHISFATGTFSPTTAGNFYATIFHTPHGHKESNAEIILLAISMITKIK